MLTHVGIVYQHPLAHNTRVMASFVGAARALPNILVTGTPGTGKTSLCARLALSTKGKLQHVNVGALVKMRSLHEGRDEEFDAFILDEDKVCDELEPLMARGGQAVDFHSCDFFPERWFDLVVVLRADNTVLYDRLAARGYAPKKITENVECEIMQVLLEEARGAYAPAIVQELHSNTEADMAANVARVAEWVERWIAANGVKGGGGAGAGTGAAGAGAGAAGAAGAGAGAGAGAAAPAPAAGGSAGGGGGGGGSSGAEAAVAAAAADSSSGADVIPPSKRRRKMSVD